MSRHHAPSTGFALPAVLAVTGMVTLVFLVAMTALTTLTGVPLTQVTHPEIPAETLWGYDKAVSGRGWNQRTSRRPGGGGRRR